MTTMAVDITCGECQQTVLCECHRGCLYVSIYQKEIYRNYVQKFVPYLAEPQSLYFQEKEKEKFRPISS